MRVIETAHEVAHGSMLRSGLADGAVATTVVLLGAGAWDAALVVAILSVALAFRAGEVECGDRG